MSRPRIEKRIEKSIERAVRTIVTAAMLGAMLAGCSDIYFDRRETIALGAGDALAANAVEQMVDPWPAHSGDVRIPGNGQRVQCAVERYRTGKVSAAQDAMSVEGGSQGQGQAQSVNVNVAGNGAPAASSSSSNATCAQ